MFRGFCLRRNKRLRTGVDVDEPIESPRRKQEGVYMSYTFGPSGRQVKVILLDTRYHRDLYEVMAVILNLSAVTSLLFSSESLGRFPAERERLFKLIHESKSGLTQAVEKAIPCPLHFAV
ncbi:hypothetical protein MLD38_022136 [Melastoma candidum]|uniref:Uncharacterized protein n=1 Tax=Melastoma candidum TaxID=119954 RepID=A0ACB9QHM1_9MYRT|nr:hypothetical protein MLD38_022136 [Melastoma candidum]